MKNAKCKMNNGRAEREKAEGQSNPEGGSYCGAGRQAQQPFSFALPKAPSPLRSAGALQNLAGVRCVPRNRTSVVECGSKRSATPLFARSVTLQRPL